MRRADDDFHMYPWDIACLAAAGLAAIAWIVFAIQNGVLQAVGL